MSVPRSLSVRALYDDAAGRFALSAASAPLPEPLAQWLGNLALLENVPFNCLVPDQRMLPVESIRFFDADPNWLDALQDGALSVVAAFDEHHAASLDLLRPHIAGRSRRAARLARGQCLAERRGLAPPPLHDASEVPERQCGFLLRSAAVLAWPRLSVHAFADREGKEKLKLRRAARLSPSVLFALFEKAALRFDIRIPEDGLHFGLQEDAVGVARIPVRGLGGKIESGRHVAGEFSPAVFRTDAAGRRVLNVAETAKALKSALDRAYGGTAPPLNGGAFGQEMVAASQSQPFFNPLEDADG